jgi:hypothetical protein
MTSPAPAIPRSSSRGRAPGHHLPRTAARPLAGDDAANASSAAALHSSNVRSASMERTSATLEAAMERLVTPRPVSTTARSGSLAASPQTDTGLEARRPASAVSAIK